MRRHNKYLQAVDIFIRDILLVTICVSLSLIPLPARAQVYGTVETTRDPPVFCPPITSQPSCVISGATNSVPSVCPTSPIQPNIYPPNSGCDPLKPTWLTALDQNKLYCHFKRKDSPFGPGGFITEVGTRWENVSLPGDISEYVIPPVCYKPKCPMLVKACYAASWQFPGCPVRPGGAVQYQPIGHTGIDGPLFGQMTCPDGSPVLVPEPVPVPAPQPQCTPITQRNLPDFCYDPNFWIGAGAAVTVTAGVVIVCTAFPPATLGLCAACWVAREVYGIENPKWVLFRTWLFTKAPDWLRELYIAHGESFAAWIHDKPLIKDMIRFLMDQAIESLDNETRELVMNSIQSARK